MKKLFAILLAVTMLASMATVASAASTTTLTTTVPAASYTLNIPVDQKIPFGATSTNIGCVTVTDATGFAEGKNLNVTLTYSDFVCSGVSTTIPYFVQMAGTNWQNTNSVGAYVENYISGATLVFEGLPSTEVREYPRQEAVEFNSMNIIISSADWGKALAGDYSSTITFTAEVVAE